MKRGTTIAIGTACLLFGGLIGWLWPHDPIQVNIDLEPTARVSVVPDNHDELAIFASDESELRIDAPCLALVLKRDGSSIAHDYQEILRALRGAANESTYFEGSRAQAITYSCEGALYSVSFDESGFARNVTYRREGTRF